MPGLGNLSDRDLVEVAGALRSGRLQPPYSLVGLHRLVSRDCASGLMPTLGELREQGFSPVQIATVMDMIRADRARRPALDDLLELVTTGPDMTGVANRDTAVVVRDLFAAAQESVLLAGYAVHQGQQLFQTLADRMLTLPDLRVRLFLDIQRPPGDTSLASEIVLRFAAQFRTSKWPANRPLPQVFFDPRSLDVTSRRHACLHAKCVVIDGKSVFISSANFTEAAQERNVEVGIVARSFTLAQRLEDFFNQGLTQGLFKPVLNPSNFSSLKN